MQMEKWLLELSYINCTGIYINSCLGNCTQTTNGLLSGGYISCYDMNLHISFISLFSLHFFVFILLVCFFGLSSPHMLFCPVEFLPV